MQQQQQMHSSRLQVVPVSKSKRNSMQHNAKTLSRSTNLHQQLQMQQQRVYQHHMAFATIRGPPSRANHAQIAGYYDTPIMIPPQDHHLMPPIIHQRPIIPFEKSTSILEKHSLISKPLCRCRVMYLGSSVPHITKNGLHGIQEPLKHLYPDEQFSASKLAAQNVAEPATAASEVGGSSQKPNTIDISHLSSSLGIDSWLSVWSNGLLLENVDEFGREIKRFFSIESLHYCAAVRFFDTTTLMSEQQRQRQQQQTSPNSGDPNNNTIAPNSEISGEQLNERNAADDDQSASLQTASGGENNETGAGATRQLGQKKSMVRFLPLDAPLFQCPGMIDANHPPVFAAIMRRTTGIKVLECHAFICRRDAAANALVRCCTHAYADFLSAKRLSLELGVAGSAAMRRASTYVNGSAATMGGRKKRANSNGYNGSDSQHETSSSSNNNAGSSGSTAPATNRRHNHSSSTANTTSNEDNSLEASSEDNYAIISKRSGTHRFQHDDLSNAQTRKLGDGNSSRRKRKQQQQQQREHKRGDSKSKGSSRSLFDDFMPRMIEPVAPSSAANRRPMHGGSSGSGSRHPNEIEKLSQSLDILQVASCCGPDGIYCADEDVEYSVVKNKRFSKSMQNLDGPFQFTASTMRSSGRSRRNRHSRDRAGGQRKSTSYQDMRKNSISSDATAHSSSMESPIVRRERDHDNGRRLTNMEPSLIENNKIYAPCNSESRIDLINESGGNLDGLTRAQVHHQPVVLGPTAEEASASTITMTSQPRLLAPSKSRSRGQGSSSAGRRGGGELATRQGCQQRRADLERAYDSVLPAPPMIHHQHPAKSQPGAHLYSHYNYHPAMALQQAGQFHLAPIYVPHPLLHPHAYSYQQPQQQPQGQPIYAPAGNIYEPLHYAQPYNLSDIQSSSNGVAEIHHQHHQQQQQQRRTQPKSAARSALARFRCLSPPVNFIAGSSASKQSKLVAPAEATPAPTPTQTQTNPKEPKLKHADQQLGAANSEAHEAEQLDAVVTAPPSFLSSATAAGRQKKMSWIKRLSLTMSAGGNQSGDDSDVPQAAHLSTDPSGGAGPSSQSGAQRKRRSGLFSGSLTLGRSKQQHPKLITS